MTSVVTVQTRKELEQELNDLKEKVATLVQTGYRGTTIDFCKKLGYHNEDLLSSVLAELEYEGKVARVGRKTIPDSEEGRIGYPIIMGVYGPCKESDNKQKKN